MKDKMRIRGMIEKISGKIKYVGRERINKKRMKRGGDNKEEQREKEGIESYSEEEYEEMEGSRKVECRRESRKWV
jgi:hypothetical protein